ALNPGWPKDPLSTSITLPSKKSDVVSLSAYLPSRFRLTRSRLGRSVWSSMELRPSPPDVIGTGGKKDRVPVSAGLKLPSGAKRHAGGSPAGLAKVPPVDRNSRRRSSTSTWSGMPSFGPVLLTRSGANDDWVAENLRYR